MKILVDGRPAEVMKTVSTGRVIVCIDGVYLFADVTYGTSPTWHLSTRTPSEDEVLVLAKVIEDNGGFDHTTVVKEPK